MKRGGLSAAKLRVYNRPLSKVQKGLQLLNTLYKKPRKMYMLKHRESFLGEDQMKLRTLQ